MNSNRSLFVLATFGLGLLFAAAVLLPHALQRFDLEYPFRGIAIMGTDAENYYAARVRDIADGFPSLGNAYYADLKDTPSVQPPLPEWIIATISRILHLDPVSGFVFCKGLFAFLLTIAMVGAFASISGMPWLSLVAVSVLLFANALLNAPWDLFAILRGELSPGFLRFSRPINPQWPVFLFFTTLWILSSWIQDRRLWKIVAVACTTLLMLYSYVYAWTYMGATLALLLVYFAVRRDRVRLYDLMLLGTLCVLGGLPYFLHVFSILHHPWYAESAMRQGLVPSRHIVLGAWALLFLPLSIGTRRLFPKIWPLLPALAFGGLLALNQQVITGSALVPHHYHWYFIQPLVSVVLLVTVFVLLLRLVPAKVFSPLLSLVLLCSVAFGFFQQWDIYQVQRKQWGELQGTADLFEFLREHTKPGIVVGGAREGFIDDYVPIYTSADAYATLYANLFLVSRQRAQDAFFFRLWMNDTTPAEAEKRLLADLRSDLSSALHAIYYREAKEDMRAIPDSEVTEVADAYYRYYALSLDQKLKLHRLDMVVIERADKETSAVRAIRVIGKEIYEDDRFTVVELRNN